MVGWWMAQGNAMDISGNGYHGQLEDCATFAWGKVGQAFELDGVDDYVETMLPSNVQHSRQLEFGTAFDHLNVDFSNGVQFRRVDHL